MLLENHRAARAVLPPMTRFRLYAIAVLPLLPVILTACGKGGGY
jgi:hypothetical protein